MTLKSLSHGFNLSCAFPYLWWVFTKEGKKYIKVDFLVWPTVAEDILPKISSCGIFLYLHNTITERFLGLQRVFAQYTADELPRDGLRGRKTSNHSMYEEGVKCINAIHEKHSMEEIKPVVKVPLPFKVQQDFFDLYQPDGKGYGLTSYPHKKDRHLLSTFTM